MEIRRLTIAGVLENVPRACDFVVGAARDAGLDDHAVHHCHLAVDETCTNVVEHAYTPHRINGVIDITCQIEGRHFVIVVADAGAPFDPLMLAEPAPGLPSAGRAPGGWGIVFIKRFMDNVTYRYADGRNHLIMKKVINTPHADSSTEIDQPLHIQLSSLAARLRLLALSGRLDSTTVRALDIALRSELAAGNCQIVIDMHGVNYTSSAGIKTLVAALQGARASGGDVWLARVRPRVREVLEIVGLDSVFVVVNTPDEVINLASVTPL
jgi:serine/threonine-protein kinase RsbW